jgi:hypothetical protein
VDNGFLIRPRSGPHRTYALRDPVTVREPVETELDAARAVAATGQGSDGRPGGQGGRHHHDPRAEHPSAEVVVDPLTRERIERERDLRATGEPHPDEAMLRQRAYGRPPAGADGAPVGDSHADIQA